VKKFYHLEEDEVPESEKSSEEDEESEEEVEYDPARGIGVATSSEDSDEESEEEEEEDLENEFKMTAIVVEEDIPMGAATSRLAAVNLDWDNIHAVDILAVLQSFIPTTSTEVVRKVTIYPSEFGKERMKREATEGPAIFEKEHQKKSSNATTEVGEEGEVDTAILRKYQLERLRYYYAIIECSSVNIAQHLYKNIDASELGGTANIFDLRFVPDDVTFDETPKEEAISVPDNHQPPEFVTDALQHSKPKLTWEGDDPERKRLIADAFKADADTGTWEALIGSSDEEEEANDEMREKYRRLLLGKGENDEALPKENGDGMLVEFPNTTGDEEAEDNDSDKEETTIEKYLKKERERKQRKRAEKLARRETEEGDEKSGDLGFEDDFFERSKSSQKRKDKEAKRAAKQAADEEIARKSGELELIMHDEAEQSANHFNLNHILKAQKKVKHKQKKRRDAEKELDLQEGFQMDVDDPRFADIYRGGDFAIDPNSAAFRKGAPGMEALLAENRRRKREAEGLQSEDKGKKKSKLKRV
jgi:hypothetical protein